MSGLPAYFEGCVQFYNYYTHTKEQFIPITDGMVGIYACGPTVYGDPHLGHARSAVVFDVLFRYLQYKNYSVRYVRNITDVGHLEDELNGEGEDKLAKRAKLEKREPMEVAHYYTRRYHDALSSLNVLSPSIEPLASGHIPEQQQYISRLIQAGWAYHENGSVYFNLEKFLQGHCQYGKLSGKKPEDLLVSTRALVRQDEKHSPLDFALWKRADDNHLMKWNFSACCNLREFGAGADDTASVGFPGWHIECSAMSEKYLGVPFDIHGGGLDLQFPHHEAEIAQCCALHGTPPANYWLYNNMITIENRKMSKSLGNFITLEEFFTGKHERLQRAYAPDVVRFFLLRSHYRSLLDVSDDALFSVARGMAKLTAALQDCRRALRRNDIHCDADMRAEVRDIISSSNDENSLARDAHTELCALMDDDMDTPAVVAKLFTLAARIETLTGIKSTDNAQLRSLAAVYHVFYTCVLGLQPEVSKCHHNIDALMQQLLNVRKKAREEKNFALSDALRDVAKQAGITMHDNLDGSNTWSYDMMNHGATEDTDNSTIKNIPTQTIENMT